MSRWLMIAGAILMLLGAAIRYAPWLLTWFGRLPGDLRFEAGNTKTYIPLASMLIVSVVATLIIHFFRR